MEEWRDIPGYEGSYQVSNEGNLKSLANDKSRKEKLLKPVADGGGYLLVRLYKDGNGKTKRVHRLVAEAFLPNPNGYPQVNHKDECKVNNTVCVNEDGSVDLEKSNLEWSTNEYNHNYGTHNERIAKALTNGKCSKQVFQYTLEGTLVKIWASTMECGRNGFRQSNVAACCRGKLNKYKGYRWSYNPQ